MNARRIRALLRKEWLELRGNRMLVMSAVTLPLAFLGNGLVTALAMEGSSESVSLTALPHEYAQYGERYGAINQLNDMAIMLLMLTPALLPSLIGSFSIVGEKQLKALEPLLATPMTTGELMTAKATAAAVIPILAGWGSCALFIGLLGLLGSSPVMVEWLLRPALLIAMAVWIPLLGILSTLVAVAASSRSQDPRAAQAWSSLVIIPVLGLGVSVLTGVVIDMVVVAVAVTLTAVACLLMGPVAIWLFRREVILTRWK